MESWEGREPDRPRSPETKRETRFQGDATDAVQMHFLNGRDDVLGAKHQSLSTPFVRCFHECPYNEFGRRFFAKPRLV